MTPLQPCALNDSASMNHLSFSQSKPLHSLELERPCFRRFNHSPDNKVFHPVLACAQAVIAFFLIGAGLEAQGKPEVGGVIGNTYLTLVCMGGAGIGGFIYVVMNAFTLKVQETSAVRGLKFIVSLLIGCVFTPWAIHHYSLSEEPSDILALSTLVGLVGWGVVMTLLPWAASFIPNAIKAMFKGNQTSNDP